MRQARPDYVFIGSIAVLLFFGALVLMSATAVLMPNDTYFFIKRQLALGIVPGLAVFCLTMGIPYARWRTISVTAFGVGILLLIAVLIPGVGSTQETFARSWIRVFGLSFQPVEFVKLSLIVFLAHWLSRARPAALSNWQTGFLPLIAPLVAIGILLMLQPNLGSFLIIAFIACTLFIVGGGRVRYMGLMIGGASMALLVLVVFMPHSHVVQRLHVFADPSADPLGTGWQINQSYMAIGLGGWLGKGWGGSLQKFQYLPQIQADAIFSIMAEELGFAGTTLFVFFLLFIFLRMMRIAEHAPDRFGALLVAGVAAWFIGQSFINMSAMMGLFPLTGLPLPLVSHGGTAMIMMLAALGIVANVSRAGRI